MKLIKLLKQIVAGSTFVTFFSLSVTAWGDSHELYEHGDFNPSVTEDGMAVGLEIRGFFNSFPFTIDTVSVNAVSYSSAGGDLADKSFAGSGNMLNSVEDGMIVSRLPLLSMGAVQYPGVANLVQQWGEHGFDMSFALNAALANTGATLVYLAGGVMVAGGAAAVASGSGGSDSSVQKQSTPTNTGGTDISDDNKDDTDDNGNDDRVPDRDDTHDDNQDNDRDNEHDDD